MIQFYLLLSPIIVITRIASFIFIWSLGRSNNLLCKKNKVFQQYQYSIHESNIAGDLIVYVINLFESWLKLKPNHSFTKSKSPPLYAKDESSNFMNLKEHFVEHLVNCEVIILTACSNTSVILKVMLNHVISLEIWMIFCIHGGEIRLSDAELIRRRRRNVEMNYAAVP